MTRRSVLSPFVLLAALPFLGLGLASAGQPDASVVPEGPSFREVLSLVSVGSPRLAPDGRRVVYERRTADWEDNRYDTEIWLAPAEGEPFQLTRTEGDSSSDASWSPDGSWVAFLADRGSKPQLWVIRAAGGEARPLTSVEEGVAAYRWSPDGSSIALALEEPRSEADREREERYGTFAVEDAEHRMTHLWLLDLAAALSSDAGVARPEPDGDDQAPPPPVEDPAPLRRLTGSDAFTVDDFAWSPDGSRIAFAHREAPTPAAGETSDLSLVEVASGEVRPLVARPAGDRSPVWSPDGRSIAFETADGRPEYWRNTEIAVVAAAGGEPAVLTRSFDENVSLLAWTPQGLLFTAFDRTDRHLYRLDPADGSTTPVAGLGVRVWDCDLSRDGRALALAGEEPLRMTEIYRGSLETPALQRVTDTTAATAGWPLGHRELVRWTSRDGAEIEGVLHTPEGWDRSDRRPLLVVIHGGPAWISFPRLVESYVYPVTQWLAKGAIVLMPNYRGSTGYGEAFRRLNVRNLGVGDAWDVLSGVDHLVGAGLADPEKLGVMGWSQGGYISAFLATTSDRFRAISVGAGISDWTTYYVNTDIHPFTRHYLEATPWQDPEIYAKTSPITYVADASTPTLIQHGDGDRRVPIPNAYELYQGLQDVGVPTELIVYKGFGHGITRPKERLAATWHNWQWFARHLWEEEVELPLTDRTP